MNYSIDSIVNGRRLIPLLLLPVLGGCESVGGDEIPAGVSTAGGEERFEVRELPAAQVELDAAALERQRLIADILYEGLQALDDNRLLTPLDDNAHARFQRVLAYDPDNEIALQGLEEIVTRYIGLARQATKRGLFEEARLLLDRARFVDEDDPRIAVAWLELEAEKQTDDLFFELDDREAAARSEKIRRQLADIGRQARDHEAFFLITAPNDGQARWMYSVMRAAVDGYRLRGNIELTGRTTVRLRLPDAAP